MIAKKKIMKVDINEDKKVLDDIIIKFLLFRNSNVKCLSYNDLLSFSDVFKILDEIESEGVTYLLLPFEKKILNYIFIQANECILFLRVKDKVQIPIQKNLQENLFFNEKTTLQELQRIKSLILIRIEEISNKLKELKEKIGEFSENDFNFSEYKRKEKLLHDYGEQRGAGLYELYKSPITWSQFNSKAEDI